jgi:UDP-N-acetylglucosamine 2-epimerase (non-hydrolysing)
MSEVLLVVGTRPEAIKLLPVYRALCSRGAEVTVVTTGQHREMVEPLMDAVGFPRTFSLGIEEGAPSLAHLSSRLLTAFDEPLATRRPNWIVVQGDTTSVAMGALAGYYRDVKVAHVEAGLRTFRPREPFPEELNRQIVSRIASLHFAPTQTARANLLREGIDDATVHVVGNTIVDAVRDIRTRVLPALPDDELIAPILRSDHPLMVVTAHRRENHGPGLAHLADALVRLAQAMGDGLQIALPVHMNPAAAGPLRERLTGIDGVHLLPPLLYPQFLKLLGRATLVLTDSGGVQEECAVLGIPLLIARNVTERAEAVDCGVGEIVGVDPEAIFTKAMRLLKDPDERRARSVPSNAFGDGLTGERIASLLLQ